MKKILLVIFLLCSIVLISCKKEGEKPTSAVPPSMKPNGLVLYIEPMNDAPYDNNVMLKESIYEVTNREVQTCTLKKNESYYFVLQKCEISNDGLIGRTSFTPIEKIIYEPTLIKMTDYAYILNDTELPWSGDGYWGIFKIENISGVEDTTIGFYTYPYLVKVNLHFE